MPSILQIEGLSLPKSGGRGGSIDDFTSDTCGGAGAGSMDEEDRDTCKGEWREGGGGRSMADTSGLGGGVGRKRSMVRSSNAASGDACSDE